VTRRGKVVGSADPGASTTERAAMMVGRAVNLTLDKAPARPRETTFQVKDLTVLAPSGQHVVDGISFDIARGEILAIAGVQGNGQTELTEAILGLQDRVHGSVLLDGDELLGRSVKDVLNAGVGFVPEDRSVDGLIGTFSIAENLVLDRYDQAPFAKGISMSPAKVLENAKSRIEEFDVRTPSGALAAGTLSGGNQQKLVMARELSRPLRLFIASQPTRGVDVGSIEFLHRRIVAERDHGTPVMIVSTELDEVLELADRIAVLYKGRLVGIVPAGTGRDVLGLMMAGLSPDEAQADTAAKHHRAHAVAAPAPAAQPVPESISGAGGGGNHD
jgi:ABC-type uncharacterized transport system ATPase subunit